MTNFKGTTVTLEPFTYQDLGKYFSIAKDEDVKKFFRFAYCEDLKEATERLDVYINSSNYIVFKLVDNSGELVGIILGEKKGRNKMGVSYFIGKKYRGRRYSKKAIRLFSKYILENTKYEIFEFCILRSNLASCQVMKSLGIYRPQYATEKSFRFQKKLPI